MILRRPESLLSKRSSIILLLASVAECAVLQRYLDSSCNNVDSGEGVQQSWSTTTGATSYCYNVNAGFGCAFRCNLRFQCEYGSGSGLVLQAFPDADTLCQTKPTSSMDLAKYLTWEQGAAFLQGRCTLGSDGKYMKFNSPLGAFPNCSDYGSVAAGQAGAALYASSYFMQFYEDNSCSQEYAVTSSSSLTISRMKFAIYRGVQYCLDYTDASPKNPNVSASDIGISVPNFMWVCGNLDGLGNGLMLKRFTSPVCAGDSLDSMSWADAFYPMNKLALADLLSGLCVSWGQKWVQMDRAWSKSDYPDCTIFACKSGYCSGGPLQRTNTGAQPYSGDLRTAQTKAQVITNAADQKARIPQLLGAVLLVLALSFRHL